ncbi:MAG: non-canonical purine NTP pyrophosphatase, partial [Desulfurococcaceae archaeon]
MLKTDQIYVATNNVHKLKEIEKIASAYGFTVKPVYNLKYEIQSDRLDDVALASAIFAYLVIRKPILVEDAGLFIKSLNGFPGVYSSFVYKTIGINGVLKLLENIEDRTACFESVAVLIYNGKVYIGRGTT